MINKALPQNCKRMETLVLARAEMATITTDLRIAQAIQSTLPPATLFLFESGDHIRIYHERERKWYGPTRVLTVWGKEVKVIDAIRKMTYEASQLLPARAELQERDLKRLLRGLSKYTQGYVRGFSLRKW